jgi:excinuclease ABC subunit C
LCVRKKKRLKKKTDSFPRKPGIYLFKDKDENIIYIGKARSLKDRIKSYLSPTKDIKVHSILKETEDISFILTDSEKEAAFLENNFIQQHQPKFNLRLKDDKSFPYLKLTLKDPWPGIYLTRKVEPDGSNYFGPFTPAQQARKTIHLVSKFFHIRTCREKIPGKRKRPCLEYDLNLCSAPCTQYIAKADYRENAVNAQLLLEGNVARLSDIATKKMQEAADRQEYEQAAKWRDLIQTCRHIKEKPKLISVRLDDMDIFGFSQEKGHSALYAFLMRGGKVRKSEDVYIKNGKDLNREKLLFDQLIRFYQQQSDIPGKILLPFEPPHMQDLSQKISLQAAKKVTILVPQKGKNKKLVDLAVRNAEIILQKRNQEFQPLAEIQKILNLETLPIRIEGFDVSNTGGEESVGSLVVFEYGRPQKREYRKYKIKTVQGPDDVASLQEVVRRRYSRLLREKKALPDLILVDGGMGQLNSARKALRDLGLKDLPIVSLAKKKETLFLPTKKQGLNLDRTSSGLKVLQNVRDEAHRFAISYHRLRRKNKSFSSLLDGIPGLGEKKKSRLLVKYRSLARIKKASPEELTKIIGTKAAEQILRDLKEGS